MIIQLNPPISMNTIKGHGYANFLIDYGLESDLYWVVFQDTGEIWTWRNSEVSLSSNITAGRNISKVVVKEEDFKFVDVRPWSNSEVSLTNNITAGPEIAKVTVKEEDFKFVDIWPFGKFKGHALGDVPKIYLQTVCDAGYLDMNEFKDLKKTLIHLGLIDG